MVKSDEEITASVYPSPIRLNNFFDNKLALFITEKSFWLGPNFLETVLIEFKKLLTPA